MSAYERMLERFARSPAGYWYLRRVAPHLDPPLLRATGGRVSSVSPAPAMLLTTVGAKTGRRRTTPLLYTVDGDSLIAVAANYGRPDQPSWYRNLQAHPRVDVLAGPHSGTYTATEITDPAERASAWAKALDLYAGYGDYQLRAGDRTIPVLRLRRCP
ncbi:deazaflavin-dependent nitroreductase family protein [Mycolicibacterium chubuense NBB4]|uniref:Deazaflavin-dependent nitroreductase family protein n=2 Tax=Mycolicibacterium chubuense TaxID=1800 RepID=I4BQV6_MYCCN|nr:deazaflavin-dependent nitroreductase family protein [Mycolicibacterium chubuense NBB4]